MLCAPRNPRCSRATHRTRIYPSAAAPRRRLRASIDDNGATASMVNRHCCMRHKSLLYQQVRAQLGAALARREHSRRRREWSRGAIAGRSASGLSGPRCSVTALGVAGGGKVIRRRSGVASTLRPRDPALSHYAVLDSL